MKHSSSTDLAANKIQLLVPPLMHSTAFDRKCANYCIHNAKVSTKYRQTDDIVTNNTIPIHRAGLT